MDTKKIKKCCFIIVYFGRFNNYFPLFLKSCAMNTDFNWLVITDDETKYDYPENFIVKITTFKKLHDIVQSKFDFPIVLETPYKLCDYKPAYGYLFEEYLSEYEFWGHCDTDTLMGNLSYFITDDLIKNYDKLFCLGHMVLYRNSFENNRIFMRDYKGVSLYKNAFTTNAIVTFDEEYLYDNNINRIFIAENRPVYIKDYSFNFDINYYRFVRTEYKGNYEKYESGYSVETYRNAIYLWEHGHIVRYMKKGTQLVREEMAYMHLQHRKMFFTMDLLLSDVIQIIPNRFIELEYSTIKLDNFDKVRKWDSKTKIAYSFVTRHLKEFRRKMINRISKFDFLF